MIKKTLSSTFITIISLSFLLLFFSTPTLANSPTNTHTHTNTASITLTPSFTATPTTDFCSSGQTGTDNTSLKWDMQIESNDRNLGYRKFVIAVKNPSNASQGEEFSLKFQVGPQNQHNHPHTDFNECSEALSTTAKHCLNPGEFKKIEILFEPRCCRHGYCSGPDDPADCHRDRKACAPGALCDFNDANWGPYECGYHAKTRLIAQDKLTGQKNNIAKCEIQESQPDPLNNLTSHQTIFLHRINGGIDTGESCESRPPAKSINVPNNNEGTRQQMPLNEPEPVVEIRPFEYAWAAEEQQFRFLNKENIALEELNLLEEDIEAGLKWENLSFHPKHKLGITSDINPDGDNEYQYNQAISKASSLLGQGGLLKQKIYLHSGSNPGTTWQPFILQSINSLLVPFLQIIPADINGNPLFPATKEQRNNFATDLENFLHDLLDISTLSENENWEIMQNIFIQIGQTPNDTTSDWFDPSQGTNYGELFIKVLDKLMKADLPRHKVNLIPINASLIADNKNIFIANMLNTMESYYQNNPGDPLAEKIRPSHFFNHNLNSSLGYWASYVINQDNYNDIITADRNIIRNLDFDIDLTNMISLATDTGWDTNFNERCIKTQNIIRETNPRRNLHSLILNTDNLSSPENTNTLWDIHGNNFFFHLQQFICYLNTRGIDNNCSENCCNGSCPNLDTIPPSNW